MLIERTKEERNVHKWNVITHSDLFQRCTGRPLECMHNMITISVGSFLVYENDFELAKLVGAVHVHDMR